MEIQEVLKETGKAEATAQPGWYVKTNEEAEYFWYRKDTNEVIRELRVTEALGYIWSPYHKENEMPKREDCIHDEVCRYHDAMCALECGHFMEKQSEKN